MARGVVGPAIAGKRDVAAVDLSGVTLAFPGQGPGASPSLVLDDIDLSIGAGEFVAVIGPSGCGKTTILQMLAGQLRPTRGEVTRYGEPVKGASVDMGYLLARAGLSPWRTARRNVELGLEIRGVGRRERRQAAERLLDQVGLGGFGGHYPSQLSQGMRQRVAIARTLAISPEIILMDEPFAALDAQTRVSVQSGFLELWERTRPTVILVTHDLEEALLLADRVVVMTHRPARIKVDIKVEFDRPRKIDDLRFDPVFQETQHRLWNALREEIEEIDEGQE